MRKHSPEEKDKKNRTKSKKKKKKKKKKTGIADDNDGWVSSAKYEWKLSVRNENNQYK